MEEEKKKLLRPEGGKGLALISPSSLNYGSNINDAVMKEEDEIANSQRGSARGRGNSIDAYIRTSGLPTQNNNINNNINIVTNAVVIDENNNSESSNIAAIKDKKNDKMKVSSSNDDFGDDLNMNNNKNVRTGRQRKKLAARSKGSEFQQRRKKRRVYFCCLSDEIGLEQLYADLDESSVRREMNWEGKMYEDVLHLYMPVITISSHNNVNVNVSGGNANGNANNIVRESSSIDSRTSANGNDSPIRNSIPIFASHPTSEYTEKISSSSSSSSSLSVSLTSTSSTISSSINNNNNSMNNHHNNDNNTNNHNNSNRSKNNISTNISLNRGGGGGGGGGDDDDEEEDRESVFERAITPPLFIATYSNASPKNKYKEFDNQSKNVVTDSSSNSISNSISDNNRNIPTSNAGDIIMKKGEYCADDNDNNNNNNDSEIKVSNTITTNASQEQPDGDAMHHQSAGALYNSGKEVFIFAFGAAVFWGFSRGEEVQLLKHIADYIEKDKLSDGEFAAGQDDMAFIATSETDVISIANDVITIPEDASAKSRLSVSFAIAQSSVLSIFESRVNMKIEAFKYIPETLASSGKVKLSPKQLGNMIGEIYVIRHDVNLHTEILDTPDFFWKEEQIVFIYHMTMRYLEMSNRTEVLNKRLDMLRELLGVLQQQHENAHSMKLEWIIIWLIVISVALEIFSVLSSFMTSEK